MRDVSPLIPMAAITGRPDKARIQEVLSAYASVGIDAFLMYPRTGLETEYMSGDWMELCKNVIETAASLNMRVWLYDEYNFPSGNCLGQVTKDKDEFYPNALVFEKHENGYQTRVVRNRVGSDILNPAVVARFIELTHQRYFDAFGAYFGNTVQGIFTDEPSFAYFTRMGAFAEAVDENSFRLPWYDGLEDDYAKATGRSLRHDVISHLNGQTPDALWEHYYSLTGARMRKVYIGEINRWCEAHGIVLTGHLMEERADTTVRYNGNPLKMLRTFSLPGMDDPAARHVIQNHNIEFSALSLVQYAGQGKAGRLAEIFSVSPTDMPLGEMRTMIWLTACFGVDHYLFGVAALDPKGNVGKPCYYYPASQTSPHFPYYSELLKTAKQAAEAAGKPYIPDISLRFPSTLLMRAANTALEKPAGQLMVSLLETFASRQVQYLYLDEDEKSDLPTVSMDENGLFLEGEDERFDDAEAFAEYLLKKVPRRAVVRENGVETRDVFVRLWADDTVTLVDLSGNDALDRTLEIELKGRSARVRLPGNGVFHGKIECQDESVPKRIAPARIANLRAALEKTNLLRLSYTMARPDVPVFVSEPLSELRLILRHDPDPVRFALDGSEIKCALPDTRLPDGFTQLYRMSEPFSLSPGAHVFTTLPGKVAYEYPVRSALSGVYECIKTAPAAVDYRYLPSAFLSGVFAADREGRLSAWTGEYGLGPIPGASDYIGNASVSMTLEVPEGTGRILSLNTDCACTRAFLDGIELGLRCWAPFEWKIPDSVTPGTHSFRVQIASSIRPMFGDLEPYKAEQPNWRSLAPCTHGRLGILALPEWRVHNISIKK